MKRLWLVKLFAHILSLPAGMTFGQFQDDIETWSVNNSPRRRSSGGGRSGGIGGWISGLIVVLFLAYIGMNLISTFAPTIGNLTYEGGGVGATIFGLVQTWLLPLALIGLLIYVVMHFVGRGRG
jgi:hypothetical protein